MRMNSEETTNKKTNNNIMKANGEKCGYNHNNLNKEYDYTADDTVPNTGQAAEEDDNGSLPPEGDEEEL